MKFTLTFLGAFLLGIVVTLFIFNVYPIQFYVEVPPSFIDVIIAIGTVGAVVVALTIAIWGDWLKSLGAKQNIIISNHLINDQPYPGSIVQKHARLLFLNKGRATAEDVEVYVNKIFDNGVERPGFLPVPLLWTHSGSTTRNFHPKQFGYLDFCSVGDIFNLSLNPQLTLVAGAGVFTYQDIWVRHTKFEVVVFQKSGNVKKFEIYLEWEITRIHNLTIHYIREI